MLLTQVLPAEDQDRFSSWYHCCFPVDQWQWPLPRKMHRRAWRNLFEARDGQAWLRADGIRHWMMGVVDRAWGNMEAGKLQDIQMIKETRSGATMCFFLPIAKDLSLLYVFGNSQTTFFFEASSIQREERTTRASFFSRHYMGFQDPQSP